LEPDINLDAIVRKTPGFSSAQLENRMSAAAVSAARLGKYIVDNIFLAKLMWK
jgi:ATP-dependent Zn protease